MSTVEHQNFALLSTKTRLRIYFTHHLLFTLSCFNLICKILVLTGLLITIFSSHWAKNPIGSNIYTGYKTRCSVHICFTNNLDPTWLVDLICLLAIVNLCMELINISIIWCSHYKLPKIDTILGLMFILTLIITDCGIVFGIHIVSCVYKLPMGYAYYCFIFGIIFSLIDWGLSLKRLINDLPEIICLTENEYQPTTCILPTHHFSAISEEDRITSSNLVVYDDSIL